MLNINKKTGDQLYASEINQIVNEINSKPDSIEVPEVDLSDYLKSNDALATYQPKGDYLTAVNWGDVSNKPTIPSIAGLATESYINDSVSSKANSADVYTKTASDSKYKSIEYVPTWNEITNKPDLNSNITYATAQDIVNATHVAFWGDSMTASLGGYDATYPSIFGQLSKLNVFNGGIGGQNSTQVKNRLIADTAKLGWNTIIEVGINDVLQSATNTTILANIATMVSALGHNRYVIIAPTRVNSETNGTARATQKDNLLASLISTYGAERVIDLQGYMLTQGDGGANDNIDVANGINPRSLMSDTIHYNKAGYAIKANYIYTQTQAIFNNASTDSVNLSTVRGFSDFGRDQYSLATNGKYLIGGQQVIWLPNQSGSNNNSFYGNGGADLTTGANDTGIGVNALSSITTGNSNTGVGAATLGKITTQSNNTAIGGGSLFNNVAQGNTAIGSAALTANTSGAEAVAIGHNALLANTSGTQNVIIGQAGMYQNTSGGNNVGIGWHTLLGATSSNNIAVGANAGANITTGSRNLVISQNGNVQTATASNQINIGNLIWGTGASASGVSTAGNIGIAVIAPTARLALPAGTATAGTAPLKLTAGTNLTTAENGAFEFDGTNLFFTVGGIRKTVSLT